VRTGQHESGVLAEKDIGELVLRIPGERCRIRGGFANSFTALETREGNGPRGLIARFLRVIPEGPIAGHIHFSPLPGVDPTDTDSAMRSQRTLKYDFLMRDMLYYVLTFQAIRLEASLANANATIAGLDLRGFLLH
jgi:hypothetical protein